MQIYCPKCKTGYEIDAGVVPENGRKLRCAVCQKVFKCMPQDLIDGSKLRQAEFTEEEKKHLDEQGRLREEELPAENKAEEKVLPQKETAPQAEPDEASANPKEEKTEETEENAEQGQAKSLDDLASENRYVKDIFERLSVETEALFQSEKEEPQHKRVLFGLKKFFGIVNPRNIKYYLMAAFVLLLLFAYYARYEITRSFPAMEGLYDLCGMDSVVPGEGLEFQNVTRRKFEEDYVPKVEVKGFIANKTDTNKKVPQIRVELLDKEGKLIQAENFTSALPTVPQRGQIPFTFTFSRPSKLTKYIYLTFIKNEN